MERKARLILGVSPSASPMEIKRAYWLIAMECHPDRNPKDPSLAHKFRVVSEAYAVLSGRSLGRGGLLSKSPPNDAKTTPYYQWWLESFFEAPGIISGRPEGFADGRAADVLKRLRGRPAGGETARLREKNRLRIF